MADSNESNGGRVTLRDLMAAIEKQNDERAELERDAAKERGAMERRLMEKLDCVPSRTEIDTIKKDINKLQDQHDKIKNRDTTWGVINSILIFVGTALGIKMGPGP